MKQPELIADLMTIAIEGGIGYWCLYISPDPWPVPEEGAAPWYTNPEFYEQDDWTLKVYTHDEPITPFLITKQQMLDTLNRLPTLEPWAYDDILWENWDADTADTILQLAAFKEVRYG